MDPGLASFRDRYDAGRQLAVRLERYAGSGDCVVLGVAGGGTVVAAEVAAGLGAPLDVVVTVELAAPGESRQPIGALTEAAGPYLNPTGLTLAGVSWEHLVAEVERAWAEVISRRLRVRGERPRALPEDATVVLVDDGACTGVTAIAAARAVRRHRPAHLVLALPVVPRDTVQALRAVADELVVLVRPDRTLPVACAYADFPALTDDEVRGILAQHLRHRGARPWGSRRCPARSP